jgi:F-type H+-transporting ATPase subunit epsilon
MRLKIVTPERLVVEEEVEAVYGEAVDGSIGILPHHIPMVTPLAVGLMSYVREGRKLPLTVMGGMLYTDGGSVVVLSDAAELSGEIDVIRAQKAKELAEALLRSRGETYDEAQARQALARALVRLKVAGQ